MKQNKRNFKSFIFKNKENNEVWSTFKILADEPTECLGAYVISMTSAASDIPGCLFNAKRGKHKK